MADAFAFRIQGAIVHAVGATMCALGRHDPKPFRSLTIRSREFRCIRCEKRWAEVREEWVAWPFQGAHPYGEGDDSLGDSLAWRGANLREDRVDQTPFPRWTALQDGYRVHTGRSTARPA